MIYATEELNEENADIVLVEKIPVNVGEQDKMCYFLFPENNICIYREWLGEKYIYRLSYDATRYYIQDELSHQGYTIKTYSPRGMVLLRELGYLPIEQEKGQ